MNKKTDNSHLGAKLKLRRYFLGKFFGKTRLRIYDACQGDMKIWKILRSEFDCEYWGGDVKEKKGRIKINSERILALEGFDADAIDIDTYGRPWRHFLASLPNVKKRTIYFLTIGIIKIGGGGNLQTEELKFLPNFGEIKMPRKIIADLRQFAEMKILLSIEKYGLKIIEAKVIEPENSHVKYVGLAIDKI